MSTYNHLESVVRERGAGFLCLLDPDRMDKQDLIHTAAMCAENGADALLMGGSFLLYTDFDRVVREVKRPADRAAGQGGANRQGVRPGDDFHWVYAGGFRAADDS